MGPNDIWLVITGDVSRHGQNGIYDLPREKSAKCWINRFYRLVQSILDLTLFGK